MPNRSDGQRQEDGQDKLARVNAKISRYRYIVSVVLLLAGGFALRFGATIVWPEQRLRGLELGQQEIKIAARNRADTVNAMFNRIDSVAIANSVISFGMAKFACMKSTEAEARALPWSCKRLFDTGELVTSGRR